MNTPPQPPTPHIHSSSSSSSTITHGAELSPRPDCHLHSALLAGLPIDIEIVFLSYLSGSHTAERSGGLGEHTHARTHRLVGGDNARAKSGGCHTLMQNTHGGNKTQTYAFYVIQHWHTNANVH